MESLTQAPETCGGETRPSWCHVAPSEAQPRDHARLCGHAVRNDAIASSAFHTGHHARDLFALDPGRTTSRSGKRRAACIWTQMDPSSAFDANSIRQSKLKTKK